MKSMLVPTVLAAITMLIVLLSIVMAVKGDEDFNRDEVLYHTHDLLAKRARVKIETAVRA